mgnify:CR=1 FL=1
MLRGKKNADGSRSKTWEEVPSADGNYNPTVLSPEEAERLQAKNQPKILTNGGKINNSSIDNSNNRDKIKLGINLFDTSDELYVEAFSVEE